MQVPVHHADSAILITASKNKIGIFSRFQKAIQIRRRMTKVRIHLENTLIVPFQGPLETCHIRRAQTHLALTANQVHPGVLFRFRLYQISRTIGGTVIHHQNFKAGILFQDSRHNKRDIFLLVIGRDDDQALRIRHIIPLHSLTIYKIIHRQEYRQWGKSAYGGHSPFHPKVPRRKTGRS